MQYINTKIRIANRDYSLRIKEEDEGIFLQAAVIINQQLRQLKEGKRIYDKQDQLAMVAFDYVVKSIYQQQDANDTMERIERLTELIKTEEIGN